MLTRKLCGDCSRSIVLRKCSTTSSRCGVSGAVIHCAVQSFEERGETWAWLVGAIARATSAAAKSELCFRIWELHLTAGISSAHQGAAAEAGPCPFPIRNGLLSFEIKLAFREFKRVHTFYT